MNRLRRFYSFFEDFIAGIFFFSGVTLIFYGIISRYIFKKPIFWVDEISTYLLVWGCILGWSLAQRDGRHIRVNLVYDLLPVKMKWVVSIIGSIVCILFCLFLTYMSCLLVMKYLQTGQLSMNTQFPLWIVYSIVPVAALMLTVRYVEELYFLLQDRGKKWIEKNSRETMNKHMEVKSHHGSGYSI